MLHHARRRAPGAWRGAAPSARASPRPAPARRRDPRPRADCVVSRLGTPVTHYPPTARAAPAHQHQVPLKRARGAARAEAHEVAKEMLADADAIAAGRTPAARPAAGRAHPTRLDPEKPAGSGKPAAAAPAPRRGFRRTIGVGVGGGRDAAVRTPHEKPKAKPTVVKAPASAPDLTGSDGRTRRPGGESNRGRSRPIARLARPAAGASQKHLQDMLSDGSFEKYGVGGLDDEFLTIFRRVFASRMVAPSGPETGTRT